MGMGNGRGAPQQIDGFTALRSAVLSVANAKSKAETMQRITYCNRLIDGLHDELAKVQQHAQVQVQQAVMLANILVAHTKGVLAGTTFTVTRSVEDGTLEFFDASGAPVTIVDPITRVLLILPATILPLTARITDRKDGSVQEANVRCFDVRTREELAPGEAAPVAPAAELADVDGEVAPVDPHWAERGSTKAEVDDAVQGERDLARATDGDHDPPAPSPILGPNGEPMR